MNVGIVVSDYNSEITHRMLKLAVIMIQEHNVKIEEIVHAPGVLEIPFLAKKLLKSREISGILAIGVVLQGDTAHDELVAFTTADKLLDLSLEYEKPITLAISGPRITRGHAVARIETSSKHAVEALINLLQPKK